MKTGPTKLRDWDADGCYRIWDKRRDVEAQEPKGVRPMRRRTGFTLIELLVVIAIIGILAAMLFPVFARAREAARKTQCLANVKNLAVAVNIYLTDYDALPPHETRQEIMDWAYSTCGCPGSTTEIQSKIDLLNPYLNSPVLLDEYTKSREVWRCPSARISINPIIINDYGGDWFRRVYDFYGGAMPDFIGSGTLPNGWGGAVTDSLIQEFDPASGAILGAQLSSQRGFVQNYMVPSRSYGIKLSQIPNASSWLAIIETGAVAQDWGLAGAVYPDLCRGTVCQGVDTSVPDYPASCGVSVGCTWTVQLYKERSKSARHLGGVNLGFLDGHAKWWNSEAAMAAGVMMSHDSGNCYVDPSNNAGISGPLGIVCQWPAASPF
jgi:prepilin-type N-terminal cleavage/methylation domain-containing protein/prepilin-type processing-associated H-X9-DG protein